MTVEKLEDDIDLFGSDDEKDEEELKRIQE